MRPRYLCSRSRDSSHRFVCEALYDTQPLTPHSLDFDFEYSPTDRNGKSIELSRRAHDKQRWRYRTAARAGKFAPVHPPTLTQNPKLCISPHSFRTSHTSKFFRTVQKKVVWCVGGKGGGGGKRLARFLVSFSPQFIRSKRMECARCFPWCPS